MISARDHSQQPIDWLINWAAGFSAIYPLLNFDHHDNSWMDLNDPLIHPGTFFRVQIIDCELAIYSLLLYAQFVFLFDKRMEFGKKS